MVDKDAILKTNSLKIFQSSPTAGRMGDFKSLEEKLRTLIYSLLCSFQTSMLFLDRKNKGESNEKNWHIRNASAAKGNVKKNAFVMYL